MRPELQKMLSQCGMAENSGSQTTLVCSNQQCSGPLYKGVRQSVSKKARPPTETGLANKWLQGKKKEEESQLLAYATGRIMGLLFSCCQLPSFTQNNSIKSLVPNTGSPTVFLPCFSYSPFLCWAMKPLRAALGTVCLVSPSPLMLS